MFEMNRLVMVMLDVVAVVWALWQFKKQGAPSGGLAAVGTVLMGWLLVMHWALSRQLVPAQVDALSFLGLVGVGVALVGVFLFQVRREVSRLSQADLLQLQGVRMFFGATFFVQALVGALPRTFGLIDGLTHFAAGSLGLLAAAALRRDGSSTGLAWVANLFGLGDIVVVLSSLSLVLLPEISPRHPMMYAVFLPAAFWAWWHVVSIYRLVTQAEGDTNTPAGQRRADA